MIWSENLNKAGSGNTHFLQLAHCLAERGHRVRILAPGYPPRTSKPLPVAVSYIPVPPRSTFSFLLFHLLLLIWLPFVLLFRRPDVVYTRGLFHSFAAYVICRILGTAYVAEVNSIVDQELAMRRFPRPLVWLVRTLDRWNLTWASAFVCVTRKLRRYLTDHGANPQRVFAIHNGAAVDLFVPGDRKSARREFNLSQQDMLIGFTGTLAVWQGLDLLIEAAARLPSDPPWQVVIVGDGQVREQLEKQIADNNLQDRVHLMASMPHERVARLMPALDLVVVPIHDQRKLRYGLSVLKFWEALAAGLPVLVPDSADLGDVLGDLDWPAEYAAGSADALAAAIQSIMQQLPELHSRRDEIHEAVSRRYGWMQAAEATERVFRCLVEGRPVPENQQ